jgi:hypothetical protein
VIEKRCSKCKRVLPAEQFNKANWLKSGLRPDCKSCYSAWKKDCWAAKPKSETALRQAENAKLGAKGLRRCKHCREIKPRTEDNFAKARDIWQVSCRKCDRARTRRWATENSERYKINAADGWARRHAAKQKRTIKLTAEQRGQIREIYAECRQRNQNNPRAWHVDHIVPMNGKTVSGLHVPWNLQILPGSVNVRKSNRTSESF